MKKLIEMFESAGNCNALQENYNDAQCDLVSGERSPEECRDIMRESIVSWIDTECNQFGLNAYILGGKIRIEHDESGNDIDSFEFNEDEKLIAFVESVKSKDHYSIACSLGFGGDQSDFEEQQSK